MRDRRLSILTVCALIWMTNASVCAEELREGESGFYCHTHDSQDRLFRKGDFTFCGIDEHLPATVGFAVLGEPRDALVHAVERFDRVLRGKAGVEVRASARPEVLFIVPRRVPSRLPRSTPGDRQAIFADALTKAGIEVPAEVLQKIGRIDLTASPGTPASLDTLSVDGKPTFVVHILGLDDPVSIYDRIVKDTITAYLAIRAPMIEPEQKASNGVYHSRSNADWLAVSP